MLTFPYCAYRAYSLAAAAQHLTPVPTDGQPAPMKSFPAWSTALGMLASRPTRRRRGSGGFARARTVTRVSPPAPLETSMPKPPLMVVALAAASLAGACSSSRIILPAAGSPDTAAPPNARDGNTSVVAPLPWDGGAWPEAGPPPASAPDASNQCAAQSFTAHRVPLDLLLLVDRSESMSSLVSSSGTNTKWDLAAGALHAFIADAGSNGLGIGLELFPADQACTTDAECLIRSPFPLPPLPGAFACVQRRVCAGSLAPGAAPTR